MDMEMVLERWKVLQESKREETYWNRLVLWLEIGLFCLLAHCMTGFQTFALELPLPVYDQWETKTDQINVLSKLPEKESFGRNKEWIEKAVNLPLAETAAPTAREEARERAGGRKVPASVSALSDRTMEKVSEEPAAVADIQVILHGNGGRPERTEQIFEIGTFSLEALEEPKRLGKAFDGWYLDPECEMPFSGAVQEEKAVELYAGWKEFPGYFCDGTGYVSGYSDRALVLTDGLVALPAHESCVGLREGAYAGIEEEIFEVYIPANITEIEADAFSAMPNLLFIQAAEGNPSYYSENGILYHKDGSLAAMPMGRG